MAKIPSLAQGASILIYNSGHTHDMDQVQPLTLSQAMGWSLSLENREGRKISAYLQPGKTSCRLGLLRERVKVQLLVEGGADFRLQV